MWLARVAAVAGLCLGLGAMDLLDTPDYQKCANGLFNQVKERLDTDMTALDDKLMGVQLKVEELCAPTATPAVTQSTQQVSSPDYMLTLLQKMEAMEETLTQMQRKLNALDERSAAAAAVTNTTTTSDTTTDTPYDITTTPYSMETTYHTTTPYTTETTYDTTTPYTTATSLGPVYPCEDSTFPSSYHGRRICLHAVRLNKCHLQTAAYHCCHTCTAHHRLPEMGPWRYMNATRAVQGIEMLRLFFQ